MPNWVPFHEELRQGAKRGLPRAVRFIFLELAMECRKGCGSVRLPVGMDDVDAVHDLLGGKRSEVEEALQLLTATLPGEEGGQPMVVLEGPERARTLRIPRWAKWNHNREAPGASTERVQRHRDRLKTNQALTTDETGDATVPETMRNGGETVGNAPIVHGQERDISPEPLERGSETSEPPRASGARPGTGSSPAADPDHDRPPRGIDAEQLATVLAHRAFAPLHRDHWLDDLAGRLAGVGVLLQDVLSAADDFALKHAGDRLDAPALVAGLVGFIGHAKRDRQAKAAKDGPLDEHDRIALDLWCEVWSKANGGKKYPVTSRDRGYIRTLSARARDRVRAVGGSVRGRDVLRHYFTRYLALDDQSLVKKRYPLAMLESQLPAIGEYEPPRAKPAAAHEPPPSSKPERRAPLPDLTEMLAAEKAKLNGKLIGRARD